MTEKRADRSTLTDTDLARDKMGRNSLQGDDQANVRNQRQSAPEVKQKADGVVGSFRKRDKDIRAREDLNKGARKS